LASRQESQITLKPVIHVPDFISSVMQCASAGSSVLTEPIKNGRAREILTGTWIGWKVGQRGT